MADPRPQDIMGFLCYACGEGQTVVHALGCETVGTDSPQEDYSTAEAICARRYAHESMRTRYFLVFKLTGALERDLGVEPVWNDTLRVVQQIQYGASW